MTTDVDDLTVQERAKGLEDLAKRPEAVHARTLAIQARAAANAGNLQQAERLLELANQAFDLR